MSRTELRVPDLGDFDAIPVIEVLVNVGDEVEQEQSLLTLESEKATMEIPASSAGTIVELKAKVGDMLTTGDVVAVVETAAAEASNPAESAPETADAAMTEAAPAATAAAPVEADDNADYDCDVLVLGAGPGGYTAAFRAADLNQKVILVERDDRLGGVCLNVGCIPSKALLHTAKVIDEAAAMAQHGVRFGQPEIDLDALRSWKDSVVGRLTKGLEGLAKQRKVEVANGYGRFVDAQTIAVEGAEGTRHIRFKHAIIAAGSEPVHIPAFPQDPRIMDSTGALALADVPKRLLVIGGGIIGLEMATVYAGLGCHVTVVELTPQLMPGADPDLVRPLQKRLGRHGDFLLGVKVEAMQAKDEGILVQFGGDKAPEPQLFDRVLVAVGRKPNGALINADAAGVAVTDRGFIDVDHQMRTNVPHIFAIGDIVGQPMLAHKATHEGKVAAEVCAGENSAFDAKVIPSVAYTDPEIAWVGLTETQAKAEGIDYEVAKFPWAASGRSLGMGRDEGFSKLLVEPKTHKILGAGIVGPNAGDLIAEVGFAIEMGADAHDIGLTVHPHPTLSETVAFAAEAAVGSLTDLYIPKKKS
ncbi:MAG: dihydrolipoyl dehydrogenase [Xanthomonadales bacterium]|nr:dihydrolipoyl dehydrogenase [Xanthomonadales bacterium]